MKFSLKLHGNINSSIQNRESYMWVDQTQVPNKCQLGKGCQEKGFPDRGVKLERDQLSSIGWGVERDKELL